MRSSITWSIILGGCLTELCLYMLHILPRSRKLYQTSFVIIRLGLSYLYILRYCIDFFHDELPDLLIIQNIHFSPHLWITVKQHSLTWGQCGIFQEPVSCKNYNGMLQHPLGRGVILLSLQHFITHALD